MNKLNTTLYLIIVTKTDGIDFFVISRDDASLIKKNINLLFFWPYSVGLGKNQFFRSWFILVCFCFKIRNTQIPDAILNYYNYYDKIINLSVHVI